MTSRTTAESKTIVAGMRALAFLLAPLLISLFFSQALRPYYMQVCLVVWAAPFCQPMDLSGLLGALLMLSCLLAPLLVPALRRVTGPPRISLSSVMGATVPGVFVSPGLRVVSAEIIPSLASDHLPVVAEIEMLSP